MKWSLLVISIYRAFTSMMAIANLIWFNHLWGDLFGSVTAAVASGVESLGGLYRAVCGGFFAALFGGNPTLTLNRPSQRPEALYAVSRATHVL